MDDSNQSNHRDRYPREVLSPPPPYEQLAPHAAQWAHPAEMLEMNQDQLIAKVCCEVACIMTKITEILCATVLNDRPVPQGHGGGAVAGLGVAPFGSVPFGLVPFGSVPFPNVGVCNALTSGIPRPFCGKCGFFNCDPRACRAKSRTCHLCHREGHFMSVCPLQNDGTQPFSAQPRPPQLYATAAAAVCTTSFLNS